MLTYFTGLFRPIYLPFIALFTATFLHHTFAAEHHFLYVGAPGIRDYLEYGGHGILVFDIDHGHKFLRRIHSAGLDENGKPLNVKGICASASRRRLYMTTTRTVMCFDLSTDKLLWEKAYEGGCDRLAITPDAKSLYVPSFEKEHWTVVDAETGSVLKKIVTDSGAHNTIISRDGHFAYLAGLKSPLLGVADTAKNEVVREIGPFRNVVRPFTINADQTRCYVNVNGLLGFEIGDLSTGKVLASVQLEGAERGPVKRHGCPSHGIALTPDDKELWLADAANNRLHIFDNTVMPPSKKGEIVLRDQPGWICFSINGRYAYPSSGEVIDVRTRKVLTTLKDEKGAAVESEKMIEVDFDGKRPTRAGNQFGIGHPL
jgi:DNA-binding beta-propeller fold protein YncE